MAAKEEVLPWEVTMPGLFTANNHSISQVTWVDAKEAAASSVRSILAEEYGLVVQGPVQQVGAWETRSNNYRVPVSSDAGPAIVLVKKNIALQDEALMSLIERICQHLAEQGIPVPALRFALDGRSHIRHDGHAWQVFDFVPGDYFSGTEPELREVARQIARLHVALGNSPYAAELATHVSGAKFWTPEIFDRQFAYANTAMEDPVHRLFVAERDFIEEQAGPVLAAVASMQTARRQVVRNSLHPHDTLFKDGKLQAIIDFEEIGVNQLVRDVGNACHRFVRQFVVHQGRPWEETLSRGLRIFMDAYLQEHPMSAEERRIMPLFIKDELLRKLQSSFAKRSAAADQQKYDGEVAKMISLLKEVACIGRALSE